MTGQLYSNSGGAKATIGGLVGAEASFAAVYLGVATPDSNNYAVMCNGTTDMRFNSPSAAGKVRIENGGTTGLNVTSSGVRIGDSNTATVRLEVVGSSVLGTAASTHQTTVNGKLNLTTRVVPAWTSNAYTLDTTQYDTVLYSGSLAGATKTIHLPAPAAGRIIWIKRSPGETNNLDVVADVGNIEGTAISWRLNTVVANAEPWLCLIGIDASNWLILSQSGADKLS
jgi:hypothetical protein